MKRREFVAALAVAPATGLAASAAGAAEATRVPAAAPPPAGPSSPRAAAPGDAALADLLVRMRCAPGGGWAAWLYSGTLVVRPEGQVARTVMRIEGFSFNRALARGPGVHDYALDEVGYYCDPATGRPLERWTNPFNGRETRVAHYRSPQQLRFDGASVSAVTALPPGTEFRGEITRFAEVGGLVAVSEDLYVRSPARAATEARPAAPERTFASLATHVSRAEDLARDPAEWLDCTLAYGTMNGFMASLGFDGAPGVQNMRLVGRKVRADALDAVPAWLMDRVRRDHPTFLDVPKG